MTEIAPRPQSTNTFRQQVAAVIAALEAQQISLEAAHNQLVDLQNTATELDDRAYAYEQLGHVFISRQILRDAAQQFQVARMFYEQIDDRQSVLRCDWHLGQAQYQQHKWEAARVRFRAVHKSRLSARQPALRTEAIARDGLITLRLGDYDAAYALLLDALKALRPGWPITPNTVDDEATRTLLCDVHLALVDLHLTQNKAHVAWEHAGEAFTLSRQIRDLHSAGYAKRAIAAVVTQLGYSPDSIFDDDPDVHYEGALLAFRAVNDEVEVARTLFARGQSLAQRQFKRSAAHSYQQALTLFRHLGMSKDVEITENAQSRLI